jgi:hypothetical protein
MHKVVQGQYTTCSDKQTAGRTQDKVKASIRSLFLAGIAQKYVLQHGDTIDQTRAARSVHHARERVGKVLLIAANGDNAKPGRSWESFPPELQAILLNLFLQKGWATVLGLAVMKKQLPYCRSMTNKVFHGFTFNPTNRHFIAQWEDTNHWLDKMTPIPASHPWVHLNEIADALTADVVYAMAAQMAELRPYMEAAVADGCLPIEVLLEAQQEAAVPPPQRHAPFCEQLGAKGSGNRGLCSPARAGSRQGSQQCSITADSEPGCTQGSGVQGVSAPAHHTPGN